MHSRTQSAYAIRALASMADRETLRTELVQFLDDPERAGSIWLTLDQCGASFAWHQHVQQLKSAVAGALDGPAVAVALLAALPSKPSTEQVSLVWTTPEGRKINGQETKPVLEEVIGSATQDLILVSYVAYSGDHLREAIDHALKRGVRLRMVFDYTFKTSAKRISPTEMRKLVTNPNAVEWYEWPIEGRPKQPNGSAGSLHAKIALADDTLLFVSSANLTEAALNTNIELGVLFEGGDKPREARGDLEHLFSSTFRRFYP